MFALLGCNGAGKRIIEKIFTTLLKPVNGCDVAAKPNDARQSIRLTGQFTAVVEILTGRENLIVIARLRHFSNPRPVTDILLNRFGQAGRPQLIFLDEPATGLDLETRLEVWKTVEDLAANGTMVFLTTQYLAEAEQLADRIAILHEGRIIASGTLAELKQLFPPTKDEYIEKQPTLEEIFLAIVELTRSQTESVIGPQEPACKKEIR